MTESIEVLAMVLDGRISGRISEWPQLKPAIAAAVDELTRLRALAPAPSEPCPHIVQTKEGTAYCRLAESNAKPSAPTMAGGGEWVMVPREPTRELLAVLEHERFPADWEAGKVMQRQLGFDVIPPRTESEIAAGQYLRLLAAATQPQPTPTGAALLKASGANLLKGISDAADYLIRNPSDEYAIRTLRWRIEQAREALTAYDAQQAMNTPNNAAAAVERLEQKWRAEAVRRSFMSGSQIFEACADELATLRATLAQPDALTSQPSGEIDIEALRSMWRALIDAGGATTVARHGVERGDVEWVHAVTNGMLAIERHLHPERFDDFPTGKAAHPSADAPGVARNEAFNLADTVIEYVQCGREQEARNAIMEALTATSSGTTGADRVVNFRGESFADVRQALVNLLKAQKSWVTAYAEVYVDEFIDMSRLTANSADTREGDVAELIAADREYDDAQFGLARARYNGEPLDVWVKGCAKADIRRATALARLSQGGPDNG